MNDPTLISSVGHSANFANMNPTYNIDRTGQNPAVPTTVPGASVITNPAPINTPPTTDPNAALTSAVTTTAASVATDQAKDTEAETTTDEGNSKLNSLLTQLGGESTDTSNAEVTAGIPQMNKDLSDLGALQTQQLGNYLGAINKNDINATGATRTAQSGNEAQISRQHGIDALLTSSLIQAKQGNLTAARDTVDRAIAAKYDPIKSALTVQNSIITQNSANLSRADKKLADDKVTANNLMLKQIDNAAQNEKDIQAIIQTAASFNAPNSVLALMKNATNPIDASIIGKAYLSDPLAKKIQQATYDKLELDISNASPTNKVYTPGLNPQADAIIANINSGKSKLSDITGNTALKNYVQQGLAVTGGGTSDILQTTADKLNDLQTMVTNNDGFTGAVGFKGLIGSAPFIGHPLAGTATANFAAKAKQIVNDIVLPNLTLLHGLGRVTDREFQALSSAVTDLSIDPKTGTSSLSEGEFKKELNYLTDTINTKIKNSPPTTSQVSAPVNTTAMIGPDGQIYNVPNANVDAFIKAGGKKQ